LLFFFLFFFFFQAEDGIRDTSVTGVQTCALPIFHSFSNESDVLSRDPIHASLIRKGMDERYHIDANNWICSILRKAIILKRKMRSEERRVGKECRSRWSA